MEFISTTYQMGFFSNIMSNTYLTALLLVVVLLASELMMAKKNMHYNRGKDGKMDQHILNKKYHLNEKKRIDIDYINKTISRYNVIAIVTCGVVICALAFFNVKSDTCLVVGVIVYLLLIIVMQYWTAKIIADKYADTK